MPRAPARPALRTLFTLTSVHLLPGRFAWPSPSALGREGESPYKEDSNRWNTIHKKSMQETTEGERLEEMLDRMNGAPVFSLLDLMAGYHQIRMPETYCENTAFQFGRGKYEFTRMPFDLRNAPTTFQCLTDEFLEGLNKDGIQIYMDDIIVSQ
ncbi:hypothetical protein AAG570_009180 [Ranatra chinensis]|uniref:Reverse transcriptase domain-containing protein n=1 Tax=Ranatra chinensis TaxID=642074 RepID=A0ABD0YTC5_9HEMI